ncbi:MAG: shikimate kinase [Lachnospiraceae bacterium]|nr:shikimate kinase [Lachnospiraceae bacterium]
MKNNIILIGFMGSGKTSVGGKLSRALHYDFLDTDGMLEEEFGCTIREFFAEWGEEEFRKRETMLLSGLSKKLTKTVLSTGGGLPLCPQNAKLLREMGRVIYLKASEEETVKRLSGDTTRPILAGEDLRVKVHRLLEERMPLYKAAAHYTLETDGKSFYEIINEIECIALI